MRYVGALGSYAGLVGAFTLGACSPKENLPLPAPAIVAAPYAQAAVDRSGPVNASDLNLLYVTDRALREDPQTSVPS